MPHLCIAERVIHEAQKSLIGRETIAEVPLTGLSFNLQSDMLLAKRILTAELGKSRQYDLVSGFSIAQRYGGRRWICSRSQFKG